MCMCVHRSLGGFKSNVCNKVAPEGCIAEGYIATELATFCSRYLDNAPTFTTDLREILMVQREREHELA
jgi:hypothetical protein